MRGVWIATVNNLDWPSKPGLPVAQQKAELRAMLDRIKQLNMNAVFFQVRPAADAFYKSPYEPWSEFLTGKQGQAPKPYYNPLKFAIKEAHKRGLELQAWFNPFRASFPTEKSPISPKQVIKKHPGWVVKYGKYYWINPGIKKARQYCIKVITDVARRYDIDGVHLDDYFYPYPTKNSDGHIIPFPDEAAYHKYVRKHGKISRGNWRRQNINTFIKNLHKKLRKVTPDIRFGISPFGIWRPGHPPQIKGFDAYSEIYADSRKWLRKGWVDYLAPELYWPIDQTAQSFPVLLKWWVKQNIPGRHLWAGLFTNRVGKSWKASEIIHQIQLIRNQRGASGEIHFSITALMNNSGDVAGQLLTQVYNKPALIPATTWLPHQKPRQPDASLEKLGNHWVISLSAKRRKSPWLWVVKIKYGNHWKIDIIPGWKESKIFPGKTKYGSFGGAVVSVVDRLSIESAGQMLLPGLQRVEKKPSFH
jgi:uncharacterized lipoprotein YddW (UPF0748 family)